MAVYTTRELKKWDVYYIEAATDFAMGKFGRPAIILSPDRRNDSQSTEVTIVFLTTSPQNGNWNPVITSTGRKSYALCGGITTTRRDMIGTYLCTLKESEIAAVKRGLSDYLELNESDDELASQRIENQGLTQKIAELETKLSEAQKALDDKDIDCKVFETAYRRVLDRLADQQIERDLAKPKVKLDPLEEVTPAPVVEEVELEPTPELLDINRCPEEELLKLGIKFTVARNITAARPFLKMDDVRIVPGMTQIGFALIEKKITLGDISEYLPKKKVKPAPAEEVEVPAENKVNINTVSATELHERLGVNINLCYSITGVRKRNGLYKSVEELKDIPRMTGKMYETIKDMVCV